MAIIDSNLEFYSVVRSIKSIEQCDVCLLIIDANRGFDSQIKNIYHHLGIYCYQFETLKKFISLDL